MSPPLPHKSPPTARLALGVLVLLAGLWTSSTLLATAHAQDPAPPEAGAGASGDGSPPPTDPAVTGGEPVPPPDAPPVDPAPTASTEGEAAAEAAASAPPPLADEPSPWSAGLMTSMMALFIGGFSAVLGIWVDRDKSRPMVFAAVMSVLITAAIGVGATQSYLDAVAAIQQKQDLERMLSMVNEIAVASGDQSLADLVTSEGGPSVTVPPPPSPEPAAADTGSAGEAPTEGAVAPGPDGSPSGDVDGTTPPTTQE